MPTYEEDPRFWHDWAKLSPDQQDAFLRAVRDMIEDLKAKRPFRSSLRVKRFQRLTGTYELSWSHDGRALFRYGASPQQGETHIIWLRVGTHDIFVNP